MKDKSIIALLGLALGVPAAGQVVKTDSISGFNAIDYLMQTRYQFPDKTFQKKSALDNLYLQVGAGLFNPNQRGQVQVRDMQEVHFNVGKNISRTHGVRVGVSYGTGHERTQGNELQSTLVHADHLFNVSSYIGGYNPDRFFEVSTVWGLGYQWSTFMGQKNGSLEGHLGAELRLKAGEQAYITLEPMIQINNGRVQDNWRYVGLGSGVTLNYQYYLRPLTPDGGGNSRYTNISPYFIEAGMGYQFRNLASTGLWGSRGASYQVNMGKWFSPALGARAGFGVSSNTYDKEPADGGHFKYWDMGYAEGHMEALLNPLGLVKKNALDARAGFHVFGGVTFGGANMFDMEQNYHFSGYTAGLNAWYKLQPGLQLYIEPRAAFIRGNHENETSSFLPPDYEKLYSLNIGLRMNAYTWAERKNRYERNPELFQKRFFAQLAGGIANANLHQWGYGGNDVPDLSGRISLGYRFSALHGVRVNADVTMLLDQADTFYQRSQNVGTVSADYLFGLSNALQEGHDKDRNLSVEPFVGAAYDFLNQTYGGHVGIQVARKVNAHTSLFLSPEVMLLSESKTEDKNRILENRWNPLMGVYAGVQYEFTGLKDGIRGLFPAMRNERAGYDSPFFIETSMGMGLGSTNISPDDWHVAPGYRLGIGHWINPAVAFRLSVAHQNLNLKGEHLTHQYQGILDVLYNPFHMGKHVRYDADRFGLNLIGGVGYAYTEPDHGVSNTGYSLNAGLQGWWRVMSGTRLFLEPRYQRMMYGLVKSFAPNNIWTVQAGLQYDWKQKSKRLSGAEQKVQFTDQGIFTEYEVGAVSPMIHLGNNEGSQDWNMHFGIAAGYWMNPLSGFRIGLDTQSHMQSLGEEEYYRRNLNLSVGYLLNVGTLVQGYRPDARVSTHLLVAPVAQYQTEGKYFNLGGEVGVQFGYRLNSRLDAYVRSTYQVLRDTHLERQMQRNAVYAAGLTYHMKDRSDFDDRMKWYVETSAGVQAFSNNLDTGNLGSMSQLAVGTWISHVLGVRFAGISGNLNRKPYNVEGYYRFTRNVELQAQVMVDPLSFLSGYDRDHALAGVFAFAGPKWGKATVEEGEVNFGSYLSGYTVGLQPWLRVSPMHKLFVQAAYSKNKFSDENYMHGSFSYSPATLALGLSLDIQRGARSSFKDKTSDRQFYVSALAGINGGYNSVSRDMGMYPSFGVTGGYLFDRFSSMKLGVSYQLKNSDERHELETSLAYQLNLSNALTGYNPSRKFDISAYGGVSLISAEHSALKFGDFVGLEAQFNVNDRIFLHAGPEIRLHPYRFRMLGGVGYRF